MRIRRVNFKPSLLSYAITVAAAGLSQQASAVDLCEGQATVILSGAAADATCNVDQEGASVTVPVGQAFASTLYLNAPDASVTNGGSVVVATVLDESGTSPDLELDVEALSANSLQQGALVNNGTLRGSLTGTINATGEGYTSTTTDTYTSGGITYTSTSTFFVADNAQIWGAARGVDLNGLGAAQISNTGTIEAVVDITSSADYGTGYGNVIAEALTVDGDQSGPVSNSGTLRASATLHADYGYAAAIGLGIDGTALDDIRNSGRIIANASSDSDGVATYAAGVEIGGLSDADFINTGVIEATASGVGGDIRARIGRGRGAQAFGVLIGYDMSSDERAFLSPGYAQGLSSAASFSNSGRITAQLGSETPGGEALGVGIGILAEGTSFSNEAGGVIEALAGGEVYDARVVGLAIESIWQDATASNTGLVRAQVSDSLSGGYAVGAELDSVSSYAEFDNRGVISASATASYYGRATGLGLDWVQGEVGNLGTIAAVAQSRVNYADALGVYVEHLGEDARLVNEGSISARAGVQDAGMAVATGVKVWQLNGEISNAGTIAATVFTPVLPEQEEGGMMPMAVSAGDGYEVALDVYGGYGVVNNLAGGVIDGAIRINDGFSGGSPSLMAMGPGGVTLNNSGRIVLSGSINSFVYGSYNQLEGGVLELELRNADPYAAASFYSESADFSASNDVVVSVDPLAQIADGDVFSDVIYAETMVKPDGFDVTDTSLFWNFETEETANSLSLVARYLGVTSVLGDKANGLSTEQVEFADDLLLGNLGADFASIVDALNRAPDANAALDVLESVGPALSGAQGFSARGATQGALNAISARLGELRGGNSGDAFQENAVWIKPFLGMAEQDSVNGIDGYDVNTAGFILGVDGDVGDSWRVGAGVASSMTDVEGDKADLDVESIQLALYASYALNETAAIDLDVNHVTNSFDSTRRIAAAGSTAIGSYDGSQFAAGVAVSNRVALGEKASFVPSAQVRYNRFMLDGYTETGAGVLNLTVAQQREASLQWLAKAGFEFGAGPGTLSTSVGAGYDTLDAALATASFAGGGPLYVSNGIKPESTVLTGGLGYRYVTAKSLEINADYDVESRGSEYLAQTLSVKFRMPF